jgi:hypothetical protein
MQFPANVTVLPDELLVKRLRDLETARKGRVVRMKLQREFEKRKRMARRVYFPHLLRKQVKKSLEAPVPETKKDRLQADVMQSAKELTRTAMPDKITL